ncbi:MAG: hypothetical protein H6566_12050 [Lewinellaceae bacterium]|nr:hypothetical protein [Lewinellaceae bacterium]
MNSRKHFLWAGLSLLLISIVAITFGQVIVEDILGVERAFGEEPLSIKLTRYGLGGLAVGVGLMLYGSLLNRKKRAS